MIRITVCLLSLILWHAPVFGQQYIQVGTGNSILPTNASHVVPIYRSSDVSDLRYSRGNSILTALDLIGLPLGARVKGVAWHKSNSGATIVGNPLRMEIWMRHSTRVQPPLPLNIPWTAVVDSFSRVFNDHDLRIGDSIGWLYFPFDRDFVYESGPVELATETELSGNQPYTTDRFAWTYTVGHTNVVVGQFNPLALPPLLNQTVATSRNRANVRIYYEQPIALDLQVERIIAPVAPVLGSSQQQVGVSFFNAGTTVISNANFSCRLNDGTVINAPWSGSLAPGQRTTFSFPQSFQMPPFGTVSVEAWVGGLNGTNNDGYALNDTVREERCLSFVAGQYFVGNDSADFRTLEEALDALHCGGVNGPVDLILMHGSYRGHFNIGSIPGTNSANVVTITSYLGIAPEVVFYEDDSPLYPEIFKISGSNNLRLEQLRFVRNAFQANVNGGLIRLSDGTSQVKIKDCLFIDSSDVLSGFNVAIQVDEASQVQVDSNYFQGFGRALNYTGQGTPQANKLRGNRFNAYGSAVLVANSQVNFEISGNLFEDCQTIGSAGTCSLRSINGLEMFDNRFKGKLQTRVLTFVDFNSDPQRLNRVYNNSIAGEVQTVPAFGSPYLIRIVNINGQSNLVSNNPSDQLDFINNSIQIKLLGPAPPALNSAILAVSLANANPPSFDSLAVVNNIFSAFSDQDSLPRNFSALWVSNDTLPGLFFDFNDYYLQHAKDSLFVIQAGNLRINNLASWQQRRNFDINSLRLDPVFVSPLSSLPSSDSLNNKGLSIPWLSEDINGVFRPVVNMDMGAYEFSQPQVELALANVSAPASICQPGDSLHITFDASNFGSQPLHNPRLVLHINGQLVERKTFNGLSLAPQSTTLLRFDAAYDFNSYGTYNISVWADSIYDSFRGNDTARASSFTQQIDVFPTLQDFDQLANGRLNDFSGWYAADAAFTWLVRNGQSPIQTSGPIADRTRGNPSGKYVYANTLLGAYADTANIYSPCIDLSGLNVPMLEFWYHGYGANCDILWVDQFVHGAWVIVDSILSATHALKAEPWKRKRVFLDQMATQVRFGTMKTGLNGAWAIDDVRIGEFPMVDVILEGLDLVYNHCDTTTQATAILTLKSDGWFANATGVQAGIQLNGAPPVFRNTNRLMLPGGSDTLHFPLTVSGLVPQLITAFAAEPNDSDFDLDTIRDQIYLQGVVTHFPYFEDFEGNHRWYSTGFLNSWQAGAPAGIVFNRAYSGQNAWVTSLAGLPNLQENSSVTSPCFDFSQLTSPSVSFQFRYHLPLTAGVNLEYSINGGTSWAVLGDVNQVMNWYNAPASNFSNIALPVWAGSDNPQLWRKTDFDVRFLAGEPNVKFRFRYYGGLSTFGSFEGFIFDDFKIAEPDGCFVIELDTMQNGCAPAQRTIRARVSRASELQSIELAYAVNGGTEQVVPMTLVSGNRYSANIPAQSMGDVVRYSVRNQGSIAYQSHSLHFIDGFLSTAVTDQTGPTNTPVTFDARLAPSVDFAIGLANLNNVGGYWMELTAKRHLELDELSIQARRETAVNIYLIQGDDQTAGLNPNKVEHLGTYLNLASLGFSRYTLNRPILMREGQQAILYLQATVPNSLGASFTSGSFVLEDSSIAVRAGRVTTNNFQQTGQWTHPSIIFHVKNPADAVQWQAGSAPTLSANVLNTKIPMDSSQVRLQITRNNCVWSDTATLRSTGQVDVGVTQLLEPDFTSLIPNEFYAVKVVLKNHGTLPVGSISMAYQVDGAEYGIASTGRALQPGDTIHFRYPQFFSWSGVDTPVFCSYPKFVLIDADRANDTLCITAFATSTQDLSPLNHRLYPNPATDLLWISWEGHEQADLQLELMNNLGSVVFWQHWDEVTDRVSISLDGLAAGMYQYRLRSKQQTAQGKLVILK